MVLFRQWFMLTNQKSSLHVFYHPTNSSLLEKLWQYSLFSIPCVFWLFLEVILDGCETWQKTLHCVLKHYRSSRPISSLLVLLPKCVLHFHWHTWPCCIYSVCCKLILTVNTCCTYIKWSQDIKIWIDIFFNKSYAYSLFEWNKVLTYLIYLCNDGWDVNLARPP